MAPILAMENYLDSQPEDEGNLQTPPKGKAFFKRRPRESLLSPGSIRVSKMNKIKDEALFEKVQIIVQAELAQMKAEMERELTKAKEVFKTQLHLELTVSFQNRLREEIDVARTLWKRELETEQKEMEKELTKIKKEHKDQLAKETETIQTLWKENLVIWKEEVEKKFKDKESLTDRLKKDIADFKDRSEKAKREQPMVMEELNSIKEQVKNLKEEEQKKTQETSSWADKLFKTQKKAEEAEKWIETAKKGKSTIPLATPPSTIINLTLEEEQRRKTRALHVRVTGLKDTDNVENEVKDLLTRMAIQTPLHSKAWRVGKKMGEGTSNAKERALIMRFPTLEARREFLKNKTMLKKTGIFLGDDLTLAQVAHLKEKMPEIKAARDSGKTAFYSNGRVVILDKKAT